MSAPGTTYNFSAGPSVLPAPVLSQAAAEITGALGSGRSVMEMSHRSAEFLSIIEAAEADLRTLMAIPDNYRVLFLQGGASLQFAMVPLNLFRGSRSADFVITGQWAKKAAEEAARFGRARIVASSESTVFDHIPSLDPSDFDPSADYFHITYNNTIYGTRYTSIPDTGAVPLVADLSSMILSEPLDIRRFGLVYAGAQKNIGPAGVTVAIVRDDLLGHAGPDVPTMLNYAVHADNRSLYNTPPCHAIYMAGLVFRWILDQGGVAAMQQMNEEKAALLYCAIDGSRLFRCPVAPADRSLMNVVFVTGDPELDKRFLVEAEEAGLSNLAGHRSVGGMRASIYNAMPIEGVQALVEFMERFERRSSIG